jgi:hypothetical protein
MCADVALQYGTPDSVAEFDWQLDDIGLHFIMLQCAITDQ